jgi:hypothetical protein
MLMKQRVEEMEREAKKLRELQAAAEKAADTSEGGESIPMDTEEDKNIIDSRSVYVGNVCIFVPRSTPSFDAAVLGRLWRYTRGDPRTFPVLWYHKPGDDSLRQVHGTPQRV